ncbi:hypothetical protein F4782DRAFT_550284 [Xylaria castorea]|nr:hypothetical protein F4782DRAFT_550284 [Xylaria castorea]
MTRITVQPPAISPAVVEAGRRFQLPPRTEKRTQGSTLFSTTARNLTSSVPFRWRSDQVKIFEDWVLFKGPNVMSADLLPLLRALDLDGYEDVKTHRRECVHDLIIVKVRRKLTKTKNDTKAEMDAKRGAFDTSQSTHMRHEDSTIVTSPRANVHQQIREPGYDEDNATIIKREQPKDAFEPFEKNPIAIPYQAVAGGYRHEPSAARDTSRAPLPTSQTLNHRSVLPSHASGEGNTTINAVPSHPATSRYGLRSQAIASRSTSEKDLLAGLDKLKAVMKEFSLIVDRLPANNASPTLSTAAQDMEIEIEYLEDLVKEYVEE